MNVLFSETLILTVNLNAKQQTTKLHTQHSSLKHQDLDKSPANSFFFCGSLKYDVNSLLPKDKKKTDLSRAMKDLVENLIFEFMDFFFKHVELFGHLFALMPIKFTAVAVAVALS